MAETVRAHGEMKALGIGNFRIVVNGRVVAEQFSPPMFGIPMLGGELAGFRKPRWVRAEDMKEAKVYNILFLCTGNSARSIIAESILSRLGEGRFRAFSAGSHPKGRVHPLAIELLKSRGMPTGGLRSKSWDEFAVSGAPKMDIVVSVCDDAAGEVCPIWPGKPVTAHWGVPDPAAVEGDALTRRNAFRDAYRRLEIRIRLLTSLRVADLDRLSLKAKLDEIGTPSD